MFAIQEAIGIGQWRTIEGRPFLRSLTAHAQLGKLRVLNKTKTFRVLHLPTGQLARPPKVGTLVAYMWLRGFGYVNGTMANLSAIDRAADYVNTLEAMHLHEAA